jgi:hypothetical protein
MRNILFNLAIAFTMTSVFVVMFWAVQVGDTVTAARAAGASAGTYAVSADQYMPIRSLEPVY